MLDADLICLQEIKATKTSLPVEYGHCESFNVFYSLCDSKGYSGVGTFVRNTIKVVDCELGFTGTLSEHNMGHLVELHSQFKKQELIELDREGRAVITDHGLFVLFNVYFPVDSGESRTEFKLKFSKAVQIRVDSFIHAGRTVFVCGDLNVSHREIDHCDPSQNIKDFDLFQFSDLPSRQWFSSWLETSLLDTFRYFHPNKKKAFTCWNTKINARPINYGTRIDYILVSHNFKLQLKSADILPDLLGSDHCPIIVELNPIFENQRIELVLGSNGSKMPRGCTCYWDNFGGKQKKLDCFIVKKTDQKTVNKTRPIAADFEITKITNSNSLIQSNSTLNSAKRSLKKKRLIANTEKKQTSINTFFKKPIKVAVPEIASSDAIFTNEVTQEYDEISKGLKRKLKSEWLEIMRPKSIPKCLHENGCKLLQCKDGPNKGKFFYCCSEPVGKGPSAKCNFFQWA
jgi:AP endonuclease-2